jgi:hypothetical protein
MAEFVDFLHSLDRIKQKFPAEQVIYTKLPRRGRSEAREVEVADPGEVRSTRMPRYVKVAAAPAGRDPRGHHAASRWSIACSSSWSSAAAERVEIVAYPELALTPYFPSASATTPTSFFEDEMPSPVTKPLFDKAREARIAFHLGYAEKDGTQALQHGDLRRRGTAGSSRSTAKTHLPGTKKADGHAMVYEPLLLRVRRYRLQGVRRPQERRRSASTSARTAAIRRRTARSAIQGAEIIIQRLQHAALSARARPQRAPCSVPAPTRTASS